MNRVKALPALIAIVIGSIFMAGCSDENKPSAVATPVNGYDIVINNGRVMDPETKFDGIPGTLFSDVGTVLVDLNWQQFFNEGRGGFIIGRYDPNDYMDVLGHSNPWTTFSNLSIPVNTSIALADFSAGIGAAHSFKDHWVIRGAINDANGVIDDVSLLKTAPNFSPLPNLTGCTQSTSAT